MPRVTLAQIGAVALILIAAVTTEAMLGRYPGASPGLGILLGRRGARWSLIAFPLLLLGVVVVVTSNHLDLEVQGGSSEIWFGLTDAARDAADTDYTILVLAIAIVTAVMAALAMPLGPLLRSMPPLKAYAVDIIGSLSGIALFGTRPCLVTMLTNMFHCPPSSNGFSSRNATVRSSTSRVAVSIIASRK